MYGFLRALKANTSDQTGLAIHIKFQYEYFAICKRNYCFFCKPFSSFMINS